MSGLLGGGKRPQAQQGARINGLTVQQSVYGTPLPLVYGRCRVKASLVDYDDFTAIPHTSQQNVGGKGGGSATLSQTSYTYTVTVLMALCAGTIKGVRSVYRDKDVITGANYTTAIATAGLSVKTGALGQAPWAFMSSNHAAKALGYSQTAYAYATGYQINDSGILQNHSFEVDGAVQASYSVEANPADVIADLLTNSLYGVPLWTSALNGDWSDYALYCRAANLLVSPCYDQQAPASDLITRLLSITNSDCYWSEGLLKIRPLGDTAVTGNGASWTPNLTPLYDLADDDFQSGPGEDPVQATRTRSADAYNSVQIECLNRANAYNVELVQAPDQAAIEQFGLRQEDVQTLHEICDPDIARQVAQLRLQRLLNVRAQYSFKLGWNYAHLEPLDLVTITDAGLGLDRQLVRINSIEEDEDGLLSLVAEEVLVGMAHAALYGSQGSSGYVTDTNVAPGPAATPVIFNAPRNLAGAANEVWMAVAGSGVNWGGCEVWLSLDGTTYRQVGRVNGGARYGVLTAALAAGGNPDTSNTLAVDLGTSRGTLAAASQADVDAEATLCWIGSEVLGYRDATLTGTNRYNLSWLRRGLEGTSGIAHASGDAFVRLDDAIFKFGALAAQIGQTVYIKLPSFNIFGRAREDISAVTAYTLVIGSVPPAITGFGVSVSGTLATFSWDPVRDIGVQSGGYVVLRLYTGSGTPTWAGSTEVLRAPGNATQISATLLPGTYLAKAIDVDGNESATAALVGGATAGGGGALSATVPASVSRGGPGATLTTSSVTCVGAGGTTPYSYSWARTGGSLSITAATPSAASTTFSATLASGASVTATFVCTITDVTAGTAASNTLTVTITRGSAT